MGIMYRPNERRATPRTPQTHRTPPDWQSDVHDELDDHLLATRSQPASDPLCSSYSQRPPPPYRSDPTFHNPRVALLDGPYVGREEWEQDLQLRRRSERGRGERTTDGSAGTGRGRR